MEAKYHGDLTNIGLPQSEGAVLATAGVQLAVRREPHTVDRPEVTLEVLNLQSSLEVELVQLEVFSAADEDLSVLVQGGGVGGGRNVNLLQLLEPAQNKIGLSLIIPSADESV